MDPKNAFRYTWQPYVVAIALIAAAAALRLWPLQALGARLAWLTFYPAVVIAALYGGISAGLLGTFLSCLTLLYLWPVLGDQPFIRDSADWLGLAVFSVTCVMISFVAEAMRRAEARAKQAKEQLETANIKLREEINERKQAVEEFSSQTRLLKSVLASIGEGVVVADLNGKFTIWNPAAERIIQLGPVDVPPEQWTKQYGVYLPDQVTPYPADQLPLARAIRGESMDGDEQFLRHAKAPQGIWLSVTGRPLRDESGVLQGGVVAINDITDRKQAEERFRLAIEAAPNGMIMANREGRIVLVNSQVESVFGYTREELLGQSIELLVPERFRKKHPEYREGFLRDPRARAMGTGRDLFGLRKDGREVPIEIGLSPLTTVEGTFVLASIIDITERKHAEEAIKQLNARLELANKELETFSYSVSHDLRAPLRSIDGFSQALLEDYSSKLDAEGKDHLQRVRAATQRMAQLIDDMLNLSRVTRSEMRRERVDMTALARAVAAELTKAQPERSVDVVIAEGVVAQGDSRLLRAALENLLENAWKFTGKKPRARIEFGVAEQEGLPAAQAGKPVYFVRDNGAGFDMTYAEKLFGVFQRLHAMTEFPGTGIGLATVQRIVDRHGGRIWAEGAVDKGATFYFTL